MIPAHLKPHQIIPLPAVDEIDAYGNHRRVPGPPAAPVLAYIQPDSNTELVTEGQVRIAQWRVYLDPVEGLDSWSALEWEGRRYEVVGDPARFDTPDGRHHLRLVMRRVGA